MSDIAFLGLGTMGAPMATRLVEAGYRVTVWNRSQDKTESLVAKGAQRAETPAAAAATADIVITMLRDGPAVEAVLFGPSGAAEGIRPGTLMIDMSTIGPDAVRDLAGRLPSGVSFVDAPVAGSLPAAREGSLSVMAGGEPADLDRAEPILKVFGSVRRCGPLGTGAALKVVAIGAMINGVAVVAESLALADALGLPEDLVVDALQAGPMGGAVKRARDKSASYAVALAAKDLGLALRTRRLPIAEAVRERLQGLAQDADLSALADPQNR